MTTIVHFKSIRRKKTKTKKEQSSSSDKKTKDIIKTKKKKKEFKANKEAVVDNDDISTKSKPKSTKKGIAAKKNRIVDEVHQATVQIVTGDDGDALEVLGDLFDYNNEDDINDFLSNDLIWINNQNGTFSNQAPKMLKHQTFNGMGNDVADYNIDGLVDVVVLDMLPEDNKRWKLTPRGNTYDEFEKGIRLGYEPQYIRNTLQLNNGNGTFSDISQLAGIEATEWSWSALFADLDNDGLKEGLSDGDRLWLGD